MNRALLTGMTLAGLACVLPTVAVAQYDVPPAQANCVITRQRPVVSTQLRTQQVTTFCDVTETQMSQRQVVENVPVTTCKNVTVDEGGYQMVWVPKPVTKQVAQTSVRQQVRTVAVPVQVTRRVPRVSSQVVPIQSVQYVNETVPVQMTAMASSCDSCSGGPSLGYSAMAPQLGFAPAPYQVAPYSTAAIPSMPAITVPQYPTTLSANPRSTPDSERWQTVPSRQVPEPYESVPARSAPTPRDDASVPTKRSTFSRPSAAAVWQSQNSR